MKSLKSHLSSAAASCLVVLLSSAQPAIADDSEVYTSSTFTAGQSVRPNVLFVIDTSGSMNTGVNTYDPTQTYSGPCDNSTIYWRTNNSAQPPECTTTRTVTLTANRCRAAHIGMTNNGWWRGRLQQLNSNSSAWQNIVDGQPNRAIECQSDHGEHGDLLGSQAASNENKYARNGNQAGRANRWGNAWSNNQVNWGNRQTISLYSGNYANWWYGGDEGTRVTRLDIVRTVARNLIDSLDNVNLGLMRYSNDEGNTYETTAEGGMVTYPISELTATVKEEMKAELDSYVAAGNTPLSETLYEAHQYFKGAAVTYGNTSKIDEDTDYFSVASSRNASNANLYESPMDFSCQKNFIVYLTDGLPTADNSADASIQALPDFATDGFVDTTEGGGGAVCPATGPNEDSTNGRCMVNLAGYMQNHDMRDDVVGVQNVTTYVVGFGTDIATSAAFLDDVAAAGGGRAYTQSDAAGLTATLEEIFSEVADGADSTFVSPTVAVNAFNRTQNLNSLFVSVFAPSPRMHWPGNLKKYQLIDGQIHGTDIATPAVDPLTGFFRDGSRDLFNSGATADGANVTLGGAASQLPDWAPGVRKMYTYLGNADLTVVGNAVEVANAALTADVLGDSGLSSADRDLVVEFIRGRDAHDDDNDTSFDDRRLVMGDPMRTRPAVAIYGGTAASPVGTVFTTTNNGLLHAFNMNNGEELWSFMPPEFLEKQVALYNNGPSPNRQYMFDGDIRLMKYDVDGDGMVDVADGDKIYAVVGFGRGGSTYYGMDLTSRTSPRILWRHSSATLSRLGQAWSPAVLTRVNVNSNQQTDPQKFVAILGAGYDESQEGYHYTEDGVGNGIYMLELTTGNLLWTGSETGTTGANWTHASMNNSIPGEITVIDMDGDTYADRMYAGDMGGRIWRFDIWHGQTPDNLVSGGMLAALGAGEMGTPTLEENRRFYYAPDASVVTPRGSAPYVNLAIGSGYRGHPLETDTRDRFYSLRDYSPFQRRNNASYDSGVWTPVGDDDLVDITDNVETAVPDGEMGWKLEFRLDGWRGEKVLAEAVTAGGVVFFPTFTPQGADPTNPCLAQTLNRTYAVYLDTGKPFGLRDNPDPTLPPSTDSPEDRYTELRQGGIAPGVALVKTPENQTLCLEGVEALGRCVQIGDVVRTYWERQ